MSNVARNQAGIANSAATTDAANAATAFGNTQGDINDYLSNVNSTLAGGNPYEAKDYLTQQNLETSGAMNAANDAAREQQQATVARTGTNSAALANEVGSQARAGQRQLTDYNATRNTENEGKWLGEQQNLLSDQREGAGLEAGLYGTSIGGQDSTLNTAQTGEDEQEKANDEMIDAGIGAAGTTAGGYLAGR